MKIIRNVFSSFFGTLPRIEGVLKMTEAILPYTRLKIFLEIVKQFIYCSEKVFRRVFKVVDIVDDIFFFPYHLIGFWVTNTFTAHLANEACSDFVVIKEENLIVNVKFSIELHSRLILIVDYF